MRKMSILIPVVAGIVVVGLVAGGLACGGWKAIANAYEDDYSLSGQVDEIRVDGKTVAVELRTGSGPEVTIHRTARYLNFFHARPAATHSYEGTALQLGGDDSATFSSIEYVVTAPAGARVTGNVGTGSFDLAGVATVDVRLSTGSVKIRDAAGSVTVRLDTGSISGKGLRSGTVLATTKTGSIDLDLATSANVEATAGTGSVKLTVPAGSYRVEAASKMGEVKLGIASDPNAAYRLALRTDLGSVELAAR